MKKKKKKKKKHSKKAEEDWRGRENGGNIPSLKKYCQKGHDCKNESELDNTRRRKQGQKKSERKGDDISSSTDRGKARGLFVLPQN